jgi:CBS domain-containing protein
MQIKDVMSKKIASVAPHDPTEKAAKLMDEYDVGSIPVCDGNKVVGIITDRDIVLRCVSQNKDLKQPVNTFMTANPITAAPTMDVKDAAKMMSEKKIRRLPIVENNSLVGMVSLGDIAVEPKTTDKAGDALKDISYPGNTF